MSEANLSGPIFDGRAERIVHNMCEEIARQTARVGEQDIHSSQHQFFRASTGNYESHIRVEGSGPSLKINDGGRIAYGPWLEGVGSRNRTTRFKGYHIFRVVTQVLQGKAVTIAERVSPRFIARLNNDA